MNKENKQKRKSNSVLLAGAVAVWAGFEFFRRMADQLSGSIREQANEALRDAVIRGISDRLDMPIATIYRVLEKPETDKVIFDQIRSALKRIEVLFQKPKGSGEKPVPVVLKLYWSDNESTLIAQDWPIALLPSEVRELLLRQKSVTVEWELPDFEVS